MVILPETKQILFNTIIYVTFTLLLFNVGFALVLAIATFYLPDQAGIFRALWLSLEFRHLYSMLFSGSGSWDTGFLNAILNPLGVAQRNWMLDILSMQNLRCVDQRILGADGDDSFSSAITAI